MFWFFEYLWGWFLFIDEKGLGFGIGFVKDGVVVVMVILLFSIRVIFFGLF